jgi:hypothetical protein
MPQPQFESLLGTIDSVNTVFTTPTPYTAGTLAVYMNGQLQMHHAGNPWTETDPSSGAVTLTFAPEPGDTVAAFYLDTTPIVPETEIEVLEGTINEVDDITGELVATADLAGSIEEVETLAGVLDFDYLEGTIEDVETLEGELVVCDS